MSRADCSPDKQSIRISSRTKPQSNASVGPTSPSTRPTKSQIVNLKCPGSTHEWGDTNAPRTPGDLGRRGGNKLHVPFSNIGQGGKTGLQRQSGGAKHSRRHEILPGKLADDRVHGSRWSGQQDWRRPDNQAVRALMTGFAMAYGVRFAEPRAPFRSSLYLKIEI